MSEHAIVPTRSTLMSLVARRAMDDVRRLRARWAALHRALALWQQRARSRAELRLIPGHLLKDVLSDMSTIETEQDKPFWRE